MKNIYNESEKSKKLTESTRDSIANHQKVGHDRIKESTAAYGLDLNDPELAELINWRSPNFSLKKTREAVYSYCNKTFREANAEAALAQILRAGVSTAVNDIYQMVPRDLSATVVRTVVSTKAIELFAPMQKPGYPRRHAYGEEIKAPFVPLNALDVQMRPELIAGMMEILRVALDDDQTAQLAQQPAFFGQRMVEIEEAWCANRLIGKAGSYAGDEIPASQTNLGGEASWPYSAKFAAGGGQNRLTTLTAFSANAIQELDVLAMEMLDPLGNLMVVTPDVLFAGPGLKFAVKELLESDYYPSTTTIKQSVNGAAGADTALGTNFAKNILKGEYTGVISRFLPNTAYGLIQSDSGFVFLRRDPLEVLQENPASGPSFSQEVFRWKVRSRWNVDWIEPRFAFLGSDGTV